MIKSLFGLENKVVLITGASSIISVWIARMMNELGAILYMTDRFDLPTIQKNIESLAEHYAEPNLNIIDKVTFIPNVDQRNRTKESIKSEKKEIQSVAEMVKQVIEKEGKIDVLINIAGGQETVPADYLTDDIFQKTIDRILIGTWNVIYESFTQSMKQHGGRILTVLADVDQGYPMMPGMGAARNGLMSLHRSCSVEWARYKVTLATISPGPVNTPGLKRYPAADFVRQAAINGSNFRELLDPKEIAWIFTVMASPLARSVNGANINANSGDSNVTPLFIEMEKSGLLKYLK